MSALPAAAPACKAISRMLAHRPVMLDETLAGLNVRAGGVYLDGTYGRGGHSTAILHALGQGGVLHALDQDPEACAHAFKTHANHSNFRIHHRNFSELAALAAEEKIAGKIDGILLDLGVSSPQFDDAARGFSFSHDGPLDMRMNPRAGVSAADWLARADEAALADVLWKYGDERNSRRIAKRIVETRTEQALTTTAQLAALIATVPGPRSRHIHPATRSFQAIRIFINRELEVLESVLAQAVDVLAPGGRLAVISFHSLEDRMVKRFMRDTASGARDTPQDASRIPYPVSHIPTIRVLKKQFPSDQECALNPRARSAILRIAERLA